MRSYRQYCKDYENIENYEKAAADNFKGWHCHHRRGLSISRKELKALGQYYNVSAEELIFLTVKEHGILHNKGKRHSEEAKKKISEAKKGYQHSDETIYKISEAHKGKHLGENNVMYGKHHSEEAKKKMSKPKSDEAKKKMSEAWDYDKHFTEETRNKISAAQIGRHWYNNGVESKFCYECPEGFVPGRLR